MAGQKIKQANIFGRIGTGIGQGLSEQLPKEIERGRLASGLRQLNQRDLPPHEYFTEALGIPGIGDRPQVIQSLEKLARQRAVIRSAEDEQKFLNQEINKFDKAQKEGEGSSSGGPAPYTSATTAQGVQSTLNPYIRPSGEDEERLARRMFAKEPRIHGNLEGARASLKNIISGNEAKSAAEIQKRKLEQDVQKETEGQLTGEIAKRGANIPGRMLSNLEKQATEDVRKGEKTESEAGKVYGEKAEEISRDFSKVKGWGGADLITNNAKDLAGSVRSIREKYPERKDRRDLADAMIGENNVSPEFGYALMLPVREVPPLNKIIKDLPPIKTTLTPMAGGHGLAYSRLSKNEQGSAEKTREIAPELLKAMGTQGSPLSVGFELEKKGYDPIEWKNYLLENKTELTGDQSDELGYTQKTFAGWLNDWWFKSFTGIE